MKEKSTTIVPMSEQFCTYSFLPASWFIFGDWLGPYLASWLPWLQTLACVAFAAQLGQGKLGAPTPSVTSLCRSSLTHPPPLLCVIWAAVHESLWGWYSSSLLILPPCSTIHPLSLEQEWPLQNCQIWRAQTFCIMPQRHTDFKVYKVYSQPTHPQLSAIIHLTIQVVKYSNSSNPSCTSICIYASTHSTSKMELYILHLIS